MWRRLRWAAWSRAKPGRASALARAFPALVTGLTMVASMASCAPCHTPPRCAWRLAPGYGRSCRLDERSGRHGRPPRGRHGQVGLRWSPQASSWPRQWQCLGASGRGRRNLRSKSTRNCALGMTSSSCTLKAREECGPACDNNSVWDAGDKGRKSVSSARSSQAEAACRCHPRK